MEIGKMKHLLFYTGTLMWILIGSGETDDVNLSDFSTESPNKPTATEQNMTCQWSVPENTKAENRKQAKDILCNLGVNRSSCILCRKEKTECTASLTVMKKVAKAMKDLRNVTLYGDVSYGNTKYTVVCEMKIEQPLKPTDEERVFEVRGNFTCKKISKVHLTTSPCGKKKLRNGKKKTRTDACTIDCSDRFYIRVPCSDHRKETSKWTKPVTQTTQWSSKTTQTSQWTSTATRMSRWNNTVTQTSEQSTTATQSSHHTSTMAPTSLGNSTTLIIGGVVGGVLGGVIITVVVIVLWWICINRRSRDTKAGNGERESYIFLREAQGASSCTSVLPDVIKTSATSMTDDTNVYEELPDQSDDNHQSHDITNISSFKTTYHAEGEYVDLKDEELDGVGVYSKEKACARPLPSPFTKPQEGAPQDTYNRLGAHSESSTQKLDTYDTCAGNETENGALIQPSIEYFVLEESQQDEGTYNKLRNHSEAADQRLDTYNKIGDTSGLQERDGKAKPPEEYFVLEIVKSLEDGEA